MEFSLVPAQPLPQIDPQTTVLQAYFPARIATFVQTVCFAGCGRAFILYVHACFAIIHYAMVPYLPIAIEQYLTWINLLSCLYYGMVILEARADVVRKLVMQTYEFWFIQIINVILFIAYCVFLNDARSLLAVPTWFGPLAASLLDAAQFKTFMEVVLPVWTIANVVPPLTALLLNRFPQPNDVQVLKISKYGVSVREIILNCFSTIAIMVLRNTFLYYRARTRQSTTTASTTTMTTRIKSISFRSSLRVETAIPTIVHDPQDPLPRSSSSLVQVRLIAATSRQSFHSKDIQWPALQAYVSSNLMLWLMITMTLVSWSLGIACFPLVFKHPDAMISTVLPILALALTLGSVWVILGLCHRALLRRLCGSFDVVFLSVQFTLSHLCVCEFFYWDWRFCCIIACSWCWIHVVLLSDAMVPFLLFHVHSQRLQQVCWWLLTVLLTLMLVAQILLPLELFYGRHWELQDRLLFEFKVASTKTASMVVVSTFFGRLIALFPWCLRLLYRHGCRLSTHELLLLKGSTEYDGYVPALKPNMAAIQQIIRRTSSSIATIRRIVPITTTE